MTLVWAARKLGPKVFLDDPVLVSLFSSRSPRPAALMPTFDHSTLSSFSSLSPLPFSTSIRTPPRTRRPLSSRRTLSLPSSLASRSPPASPSLERASSLSPSLTGKTRSRRLPGVVSLERSRWYSRSSRSCLFGESHMQPFVHVISLTLFHSPPPFPRAPARS